MRLQRPERARRHGRGHGFRAGPLQGVGGEHPCWLGQGASPPTAPGRTGASRWRAHSLRLDLRNPGPGVDALPVPLLRADRMPEDHAHCFRGGSLGGGTYAFISLRAVVCLLRHQLHC